MTHDKNLWISEKDRKEISKERGNYFNNERENNYEQKKSERKIEEKGVRYIV